MQRNERRRAALTAARRTLGEPLRSSAARSASSAWSARPYPVRRPVGRPASATEPIPGPGNRQRKGHPAARKLRDPQGQKESGSPPGRRPASRLGEPHHARGCRGCARSQGGAAYCTGSSGGSRARRLGRRAGAAPAPGRAFDPLHQPLRHLRAKQPAGLAQLRPAARAVLAQRVRTRVDGEPALGAVQIGHGRRTVLQLGVRVKAGSPGPSNPA